MRLHQWISGRSSKAVIVVIVLACALAVTALASAGSHAPAAVAASPRIEASIFSYDGKEFVRTKTTLTTKEGRSAAGTSLDHASPAYQALTQTRSYSGEATVFGRKYDAHYAPLTGPDGSVTGALFIGVAK
jgi:methyl-accepting chemotaxis protein-2 (aspartate sensor receptor)